MYTRHAGRNAATLVALALLATVIAAVLWSAPPATGSDGGSELQVEKTAITTFTRTIDWEVAKSVTPRNWYLFTGDSGTSVYTVRIGKTVVDSHWAVSGTITIRNPAQTAATITGVTDTVSPSIVAPVDCGVSFPYQLGSGQTLVCTYSASLPDGKDRQNTVDVTTTGAVTGASETVDVIFGDPTTTVGYEAVNVWDSHTGDLGTFTERGKVEYTREFSCESATDGYIEYPNTATIVETGESDAAGVRVKCYDLTVTKNADTSFDRKWTWQIDKSADETSLSLTEGQLATVDYEVTVDATAAEGNGSVSGDIWIANPNPERDAELTAVSDVVSPNIAADVDCTSLTVPSGGSLHCTYSADLPDDADRTNTATATLQNHDFGADGSGTPSGTTDFTGSALVTITGTPAGEVDECIDVTDTNVGLLGTVCAGEVPKTFTYSLTFGTSPDADVVLECGENSHPNVASFVTNDTAATGEDHWTVLVDVVCGGGCTLTPGYWKTHSAYGPAPFDDTWNLIQPAGQDSPFYLSGMSYYRVMWTSPSSNAYYILAHAYIAAELNQFNGASIPGPVLSAFNTATGLLETYTPAQIGVLRGNNALRQQFVALGGILDAYNNGVTGPGHCTD